MAARRPALRRAVVLADPHGAIDLPPVLDGVAAQDLHVVALSRLAEWRLDDRRAHAHAAADLDGIELIVRRLGACDLIVDALDLPASVHDDAFARLFLHVMEGGAYAILRGAVLESQDGPAGGVPARLWRLASLPPEVDAWPRDERELRRAMGRVVVDDDVIAVSKTTRHYLKVRESTATSLLETRLDRTTVRELAERPGGRLTMTAEVTSHGSDAEILGLSRQLDYPAVRLRDYAGRIGMVSNGLLFTEDTVLPESFRHHRARDLRNRRLVDAGRSFARIPHEAVPRRRLRGSYFHLDSENAGHFGHLMTEEVSRLWGWDAAKSRYPDLKVVFRVRSGEPRAGELERQVLGAYGIDRRDVVCVDEPVWLDHVVAATPMWHNQFPHHVHPDLTDVWARLTAGLVDRPPSGPRRVFITRGVGGSNRMCHNATSVEDVFAQHGFDVVVPETLSLRDQAALFAGAEVIAGFGGSSLYNLVHARRARTLIVLNHEAYTSRAEHLFTALLGCDAHYFWSRPDVPHPPARWTWEAYFSPWSFDWERNGAALRGLLGSLA